MKLSPELAGALQKEQESKAVKRESDVEARRSTEEAGLLRVGLGMEDLFDAKARQENPNLDLPVVTVDGTDFGLPDSINIDADVSERALPDGSVLKEVTFRMSGTRSPEEAAAGGFPVHMEDKTFVYQEVVSARAVSAEDGVNIDFQRGEASIVNGRNQQAVEVAGAIKSPESFSRLMREYAQALLRKDSNE